MGNVSYPISDKWTSKQKDLPTSNDAGRYLFGAQLTTIKHEFLPFVDTVNYYFINLYNVKHRFLQ